MLPELDKNAAFIWACYGLGALMILATIVIVTLKARAAKAGLVRHAGQDDLGFVLVVRDAGNEFAFHLSLFDHPLHFFLGDDQRARQIVRRSRIVVDEADLLLAGGYDAALRQFLSLLA